MTKFCLALYMCVIVLTEIITYCHFSVTISWWHCSSSG